MWYIKIFIHSLWEYINKREGYSMVNELKVFYNGEKGLMTFEDKKIVFQHRYNKDEVKEGLGIIVEDSLWDKGNYSFAMFKNVHTVVPTSYYNVAFFANRGLPLKIEKGLYGDNVLLRETYKDRKYIRAYKEDGTVGLFESEKIKNENYEGKNIYFTRLNTLVSEWKDITEEIVKAVYESIVNINCKIDMRDEAVINALNGLGKNKIYLLKNGVIVADGKFENLVIWKEENLIKMTWLGRKLDFSELIDSEISNNKD